MSELAGPTSAPAPLALVAPAGASELGSTTESARPSRAPRAETPSPTLRARLDRLRIEELEASAELRRLTAAQPRMVDAGQDEDRAAAERLGRLADGLRATLVALEIEAPATTRGLLRVHDVRRQLVTVLTSQLVLLRDLAGEGTQGEAEITADLHGAAA